MSKLLLSSIVLAVIMGSSPARQCTCQPALEQDLPHGANEIIEYSETTVKSIRGRVVYNYDDSPADNVVVEIYEIRPADKKLRATEISQQRERRVACVTSNDGSFCFGDLPSGSYVVRAGTKAANAGMNEVYMKVNVDRRWWSRWLRSRKEIMLALTPGT